MKIKSVFLVSLFILISVLITITVYIFYERMEHVEDDEDIVKENLEIKYISSYSEIEDLISGSNPAYIVLGKSNCTYCERFKPILRSLVEEYRVDIYYIDVKTLTEDDYKSTLDSGIVIPGKCTKSGEESTLREGFGTPLSLVIKEKKTIDCLRGYNDYATTKEFLSNNGFI